MAAFNFNHAWQAIDHDYYRGEGILALTIGMGSYVGSMKIYDYFEHQPPGSEGGTITIGRYCSCADGIVIQLYGAHNYRNVTTSPLMPICPDYQKYLKPVKSENIRIGNDVWIGNDARILSNVTVGDGAVIGANTVVAKDVPPYAIVVGNPGKVIKYRFSPEQISSLLQISWWNWSHDKIRENVHLMLDENIDKFIEAHTQG